MQLTVSLDYTDITFVSPTLADNAVVSLTLNYSKTCGTETSIDITSFIGSVTSDGSLTLNISDIDPTKTIFDDGVYFFKITAVGPSVEGDPGTWYLVGCIYIGTTSRCKALCMYEATGNEIYKYIINALSIVNDCDDCECTTMCDLYNYLISLLTNTSTSKSNVYNSCGCN